MPGPSYRRPEGVLFREVEGTGLVVHLDRERYYGLDGIAVDMYRLLTTHTLDGAFSVVSGRYDVGDSRLQRDLYAFAARLEEAGLLEIAEGQP